MARIVLAENDRTMVRLLDTLLTMDGHEVTAVDDPLDLAATLEAMSPDALLLDMVLGEQSGLELLQEIRRNEGAGRLYVVMMSGLSVKEECLSSGADDFLQKPFMPDELLGMLRAHSPDSP